MGYEVDFLPVGNGERSGDAIALRFGNLHGSRSEQTVVVIDGGYNESGEALVEHMSRYYKTDKVDIVVSTHPDADHAAGLAVVLDRLSVGALWMHQPWKHTKDISEMFKDGRVTDKSVREDLRKSLESAHELEQLVERHRIPIVEPFTGLSDRTGRIVVVGPTEKFYESLLPGFRGTPEPKGLLGLLGKTFQEGKEIIKRIAERWDFETLTDEGETSAENNSSAIILVQGENDDYMLLTGDAGIPALTAAADYLASRGFDFSKLGFLQVPHHGSQRNVGPTILNRLLGPKLSADMNIKVAFVSAAADGEPKHPSKKVTNAFRRRGLPVHATQGSTKRHSRNAPDRPNWVASTPLPFYHEVEE